MAQREAQNLWAHRSSRQAQIRPDEKSGLTRIRLISVLLRLGCELAGVRSAARCRRFACEILPQKKTADLRRET